MELQANAQTFWENQWLKTIERSKAEQPARSEARGPCDINRWDNMAKDFAQRTSGEKASVKRDATLKQLVDKGILTPKTRVLDVGAGPGSWALPMAKLCAHVTALEPSGGMIDIMSKRIEQEKVDNISIVQKTWQETDLAEQVWKKAFDLVFASMTPGIDGPDAVMKLMAASTHYCYMSAFSGPGMNQQFAPLWEKFFDRPMPQKHTDIIYPFNLVYAMGYRPDITFSWWNKEIDWDRDHTIRHITRFFQSHMEITREAEQIIADYVETRCVDGEYVPAAPVCRGAMTWSVHEDRKTTSGGSDDI
ncbi:class I SAM-dependent methyltransferase [Desulfobacter sp. UBA2225]|uniref:class I SAM-dependent methyltransferase n=1 Tax=Desulfobacter sp. UBA2225 TaxID=1961413 RepID=UPI00257D02D7|nr:class I SAM-dependent methyltransferase [Desulfobacter sp. UBA2225]